MSKYNIFMLKLQYYRKLWIKVTIRETFAPVFNKGQFFQVLSIPILLIVYAHYSESALQEKIVSLGKENFAFLATIPLWFALSIVLAPFRVFKEEKEKGKWNGSIFVYHEPQHVYTAVADPESSGKVVEFKIKGAEAETFVQFKTEYEGGHGKAQIVQHENNILNWDHISRKTRFGAKIGKNSQIKMVMHCPQDSDYTVIRVSMLYWIFD